ncbi:uncharacterized protein DS421_5g140960 [Arachis hypogaea]|nr:uncharacterized protein DS421_5g140960 [Arachis hypogaea]
MIPHPSTCGGYGCWQYSFEVVECFFTGRGPFEGYSLLHHIEEGAVLLPTH